MFQLRAVDVVFAVVFIITFLSPYFQHPYMFEPYHESIKSTANMVDCSLVVVGEGNNGRPFDGIVSLIDESSEFGNIKSDR